MSSHTTRATAHPAKPPTNGAPKKPKTVAKKMAQPAYTKTAPGAAPLPLVSIVGAKLTPTGLEMDANLTLEETFDVGKQRVTLERRGPRAMGDWMIDMERLGASDAVMRKGIEAQHLAYGTLHNY